MLLSAAGKQLASSGDYHGRDPLIDFVCPADGDYVAVIHDLSYRGGLPYRLIVSDRRTSRMCFRGLSSVVK